MSALEVLRDQLLLSARAFAQTPDQHEGWRGVYAYQRAVREVLQNVPVGAVVIALHDLAGADLLERRNAPGGSLFRAARR